MRETPALARSGNRPAGRRIGPHLPPGAGGETGEGSP